MQISHCSQLLSSCRSFGIRVSVSVGRSNHLDIIVVATRSVSIMDTDIKAIVQVVVRVAAVALIQVQMIATSINLKRTRRKSNPYLNRTRTETRMIKLSHWMRRNLIECIQMWALLVVIFGVNASATQRIGRLTKKAIPNKDRATWIKENGRLPIKATTATSWMLILIQTMRLVLPTKNSIVLILKQLKQKVTAMTLKRTSIAMDGNALAIVSTTDNWCQIV